MDQPCGGGAAFTLVLARQTCTRCLGEETMETQGQAHHYTDAACSNTQIHGHTRLIHILQVRSQ